MNGSPMAYGYGDYSVSALNGSVSSKHPLGIQDGSPTAQDGQLIGTVDDYMSHPNIHCSQ